MLTKNDLKLFEILDEFVDNSLRFWCIVFHKADMWYCNDSYRIYPWDNNFKHNTAETRGVSEIIWHYPTLSTVLRYCETKNILVKNWDEIWTIKLFDWLDEMQNTLFTFHLTKELKDWSEEQKEELYNYLKSKWIETCPDCWKPAHSRQWYTVNGKEYLE